MVHSSHNGPCRRALVRIIYINAVQSSIRNAPNAVGGIDTCRPDLGRTYVTAPPFVTSAAARKSYIQCEDWGLSELA